MTQAIFTVLGMPPIVPIEDTGAGIKTKELVAKLIVNAPQSGTLIVSGISSPILVGLFEQQKRKVASIDYFEFFNTKFSEEEFSFPPPREGQVTLIYNAGREPVKDFGYSSKLLQGLITKYSSKGLVILETHYSPSALNLKYGFSYANVVTIPPKKEVVWT